MPPSATWRTALNRAERRVRTLIPTPSNARAIRLSARLAVNATDPDASRYGSSGTNAPATKATNEPSAACTGDPMLRASSPTSSKMSWRLACSGSANDSIHEGGRLFGGEPTIKVDLQEDGMLLLGYLAQLFALERDLVVEQLALASHRDVLTDAHAERARDEPRDAGQDDDRRVRIGRQRRP